MEKEPKYYLKMFWIYLTLAVVAHIVSFFLMSMSVVFWSLVGVALFLYMRTGASHAHYFFVARGHEARRRYSQPIVAIALFTVCVAAYLVVHNGVDLWSPRIFLSYGFPAVAFAWMFGIIMNMIWHQDPEQTRYQ